MPDSSVSDRCSVTSVPAERHSSIMAVRYPVALDSDYAIWQAFANRFWPALYVADAQGRIRHHQFGEGGYAECEMVIQRLLGESGRDDLPHDLISIAPHSFVAISE
jgi:hypothetical protein